MNTTLFAKRGFMAYLAPLPAETHPELEQEFAAFRRILGFVPNSLLTMQRRPAIVRGFAVSANTVMDPNNVVDAGFKRLLAHVASRAAGCQYCQAHSLIAAGLHGVSDEKLAAVWEYPTSPLYTEAERVALDFALAVGSVPNGVNADLMQRLRRWWSDDGIVEILAAICLYGFLNRWNDSLATSLEEPAQRLGDRLLRPSGWTGGKHRSGG